MRINKNDRKKAAILSRTIYGSEQDSNSFKNYQPIGARQQLFQELSTDRGEAAILSTD